MTYHRLLTIVVWLLVEPISTVVWDLAGRAFSNFYPSRLLHQQLSLTDQIFLERQETILPGLVQASLGEPWGTWRKVTESNCQPLEGWDGFQDRVPTLEPTFLMSIYNMLSAVCQEKNVARRFVLLQGPPVAWQPAATVNISVALIRDHDPRRPLGDPMIAKCL